MHNVEIPAGRTVDIRAKTSPGRGLGRDPQRTPMQWDRSEHAGFTDGTPWLPLPADHAPRSVEAERDDPGSMLSLYRRLLQLRRKERVLEVGAYAPLPATGSVLAFRRDHGGRRIGVVLNLASQPARWPMPAEIRGGQAILTATARPFEDELRGEITLPPDEAVVFEIAEVAED